MPKVLKLSQGVQEGTKELLRFLLSEEKVKGIVTLKERSPQQGMGYSLITNPQELPNTRPLYPLMPSNAGKILSHLTLKGPSPQPLAVVAKPCEIRAFIELAKRAQGGVENILLISQTCPGVFPLQMSVNGGLKEKLSSYWKSAQKNEVFSEIRSTCKGCVDFIPQNADIVVSVAGSKDSEKECEIFLNTSKGESFVEGIKGSKAAEKEITNKQTQELLDKRKEGRKKMFDQVEAEKPEIEGLVQIFGRCIGCHGCSHVCPICYCDLCFFDSQQNEHLPQTFERYLDLRGGLRLPPDTVFYHLGRLMHTSISCVGCGMCSDVCPVDIPVSSIFTKVGEAVQKKFQYTPGKDIEEPVPSGTYKEEEFKEIGEQS
ncbi:Coenzyme F420 hydrogenase/dehydrogenase, beta subunit C-terminal domain [bacterium]|nr:Coenzyme F420 hydrogenase/dehydrogenase, beta subunit C-terminal domain [bacterium]